MAAPDLIGLDQTAYSFQGQPESTMGFPLYPETFRYTLLSFWACMGQEEGANGRNFTWECAYNFFRIFLDGYGTINVQFLRGVSLTWFNGTYNHDWVGPITNVQISVDGVAGIVQVYANDVPLVLASGGLTAGTPGGDVPGLFTMTEFWSVWLMQGGSGFGSLQGVGLGDLYMAAPPTFFDLSVTANRRKFQNADLSPVDLGVDAASVTGVQPQIYLTARGGAPANFEVNNGFGGSFIPRPGYTPIMQPPGCCTVPWDTDAATLTDSELVFQPVFIDLSVESNRRLFIAAGGTPQWMERDGSLPFGSSPAVYLTTLGPPIDFTQNNGDGGPFPLRVTI